MIDGIIDGFDNLSEKDKQYIMLKMQALISPLSIKAKVFSLNGGKCVYCGEKLVIRPGEINSMHIDHVYPQSRGGKSSIENYVPSCMACNCSKGAMSMIDFMKSNRWVNIISKKRSKINSKKTIQSDIWKMIDTYYQSVNNQND